MVKIYILAEIEHNCFKDEDRSGRSQDVERLAGEQAKEDAADEARDQGLHGGDVVVGGVTEETSKGDDGRQTGKVDKDEGRESLHVDRVFVVGEIVGSLPFDVVNQAAKESAGTGETALLANFSCLFFLVNLNFRRSIFVDCRLPLMLIRQLI